MVTCAGGPYEYEVRWSLACTDGASLSGGAPYTSSSPFAVTIGATCTLDMRDTYGDGWNGARWDAPGFGQSLSMTSGYQRTKSFVVRGGKP